MISHFFVPLLLAFLTLPANGLLVPDEEFQETFIDDNAQVNIDILRLFDADNDGALDFGEFLDYMKHFFRWSSWQSDWLETAPSVAQFFEELDNDEDGQLDAVEFASTWNMRHGERPTAFLRIIFEASDEDNNGLVSFGEYIDFLAQIRHFGYQQRNELAWDEMMTHKFNKVDANGDGQVDWEEFLNREHGQRMPSSTTPESTSTTEEPVVETTTEEIVVPPVEEVTVPEESPLEETTTSPSSSTTAADADDGTTPDVRQTNFERFDADANGELDFDEFLDYYADEHSLSANQKQRVSYQPVFRVFFQDLIDVDGNGQISFEEAIAHHSREKEFAILDMNANGFLDFDEFVEFFEGMSGYSGPQMHVYMPYLRLELVKLDGDGDGKLSLEECLAQPEVFDLTKMPS